MHTTIHHPSPLYRAHQLLWDYQLYVLPDVQKNSTPEESFCPEGPEDLLLILACFQAKEAMEETLVRWIQNICRLQPQFIVRVEKSENGHQSLLVSDTKPFMQFGNALKIIDGFLQSNDCPALWFRSPIPAGMKPVRKDIVAAATSDAGTLSVMVDRFLLRKRADPDASFQPVSAFALCSAPLN